MCVCVCVCVCDPSVGVNNNVLLRRLTKPRILSMGLPQPRADRQVDAWHNRCMFDCRYVSMRDVITADCGRRCTESVLLRPGAPDDPGVQGRNSPLGVSQVRRPPAPRLHMERLQKCRQPALRRSVLGSVRAGQIQDSIPPALSTQGTQKHGLAAIRLPLIASLDTLDNVVNTQLQSTRRCS